MTRTRPLIIVLYGVLGAAVGWVVELMLNLRGAATWVPPYTLAITLVAIGVLVIALALPVRRAVRARPRRRVDPFYATRVLVLSKACAIAGGALAGAAFGILIFFLTRPGVGDGAFVVQIVASVLAGALLLAAGVAGEFMCTVPPDDHDPGDEDPVRPSAH